MTGSAARPIVVFVDDEPMVLDGLRRSLRHKRNVWTMEFINGGPRAIERLRAGPVDAIVSDLRMPDVDGAAVLQEAERTQPECQRYILSGYAELEQLVHALGPAQRYFIKPSDSAEISAVIERGLALRELLPRNHLRNLVGRLNSLPTQSEIYLAFVREIESPLSSTKSVSQVVEADLGMTTRVLRLANSAFFGLSRRVTRVQEAVDRLGLDTVSALLTVAEFYLPNDLPAEIQSSCRLLAERSLSIGAFARRFALDQGYPNDQVAHSATAGMLAHIGSLVLKTNLPEEFNAAMNLMDREGLQVAEVETAVFGASHAELGAYLVGLWGFSNEVVEAIAFHHAPMRAGPPTFGPLCAVHVAQALVGIEGPAEAASVGRRNGAKSLDMDYIECLDLTDLVATLSVSGHR